MSFRSLALPLIALILTATVWTAQPAPQRPSSPSPQVEPQLLPSGCTGFISVNVGQIWSHKALLGIREARGKAELAWMSQSLIGLSPGEIERIVVFWNTLDKPIILVTGRQPIHVKSIIDSTQQIGVKPPAIPKHPRLHAAPGAEFPYIGLLDERTMILGPATIDPSELIKWLDETKTGPGTLRQALDASNKHTVVGVLDVKSIADVPLPIGAPLLDATSAIVTADLIGPDQGSVTLRVNFPTDDHAKKAEPVLRAKLTELAGWAMAMEKKTTEKISETGSTPGPLLEWLATTLKATKIERVGPQLIASAEFELTELTARILMAAPDSALASRGDSPATNNLKQVGIAIHNYHDVNNHCPGNSYDKDGKPLLSWRVHILPYLEQEALYRQFKLNEPWDSEHNKPLSKINIKVYTVPGRPTEAGMTYFQSFIKPRGSMDMFNPWLIEGQSKGPSLVAVTDGTSNTLMVAEAAEPVIWSKPDDLVYEEKRAVPKLGGPNGRYTVLFGDGSVRTFRRGQVDDVNLRRLITRDDGQVVIIP